MKPTIRFFALAGLLAVGFSLIDSSIASAQSYRFGQYGRSYSGYRYPARQSGPIYHAPSVHSDRVYHPTRTHWTPFRGVHTHGHYDVVPHYVPGHIDIRHRGHVHPNPRYHR